MQICMSQPEIDYIKSTLEKDHVCFEWGCGGSTLLFPPLVKKYYSVEHNKKWFFEILKKKDANVEIFYVPLDSNRYVTVCEEPGVLYDMVFIDGRERVNCTKYLLPFIKKDSFVFVHDYFQEGRERYREIEKQYDMVHAIKDTKHTMAVFKKKG